MPDISFKCVYLLERSAKSAVKKIVNFPVKHHIIFMKLMMLNWSFKSVISS